MVSRGRPKMSIVFSDIRITLRLHKGEDDDLMEFFEGIPKRRRAIAIKTALRSEGMGFRKIDNFSEDDLAITIDDVVFW